MMMAVKNSRFLRAAVCVFAGSVFAAMDAHGRVGQLQVESVSPSGCPSQYPIFAMGEDVRLYGRGYAPGSQVSVKFAGGDYEVVMGTTTADASGAIDMGGVVPGPAEFDGALSMIGGMETRGLTDSGEPLMLDSFMYVRAPSGDQDVDGVPDYCDNCPALANEDQADADYDLIGDACDPCPLDRGQDLDGDGICAPADTCPEDPDNDVDGDSICGNVDNCPDDPNSNQLDSDGNGVGDACQSFPTCSDGVDNDRDGQFDFPDDPGCSGANDGTETSSALPCDDGLDNDNDAQTDYHAVGGDLGCASSTSPTESPQCDDAVDNDGDGAVDWDGDYSLYTPDPECFGLAYYDDELAAPDPDGDGIGAPDDNCLDVANPLQQDYDLDGFGNACDGDVNGASVDYGDVNVLDYLIFANALTSAPCVGDPEYNAAADLNSSGCVNTADYFLFGGQYAQGAPGPSGLACRLVRASGARPGDEPDYPCTSVTDDRDGDGVKDAADNCPKDWNPVQTPIAGCEQLP